MTETLISLAWIFTHLSVLAFGGGNTILPEMERQVVEIHRWMTAENFSALYALGQAAPGPNLMIVTLIGWHVAGWQGLLVTTIAKFGPSSLITAGILHLWERFKDRPWRRIVQTGLAPMTAGLVVSSATLIAEASATTWLLAGITAAVATIALKTRIHPLWLLGGGALAGLFGMM